MNARKSFALTLMLAMVAATAAQAGPTIGTPKARGVFGGYGWTQSGPARSRYRAPMVYQTPAAAAASVATAQAPADARRYSYAPSAPAVGVCPPVNAPTTAVPAEGGRRHSYAPAAEVTPAPRMYYSQPGYSRSGGSIDRWKLQKTDPRKYNSR